MSTKDDARQRALELQQAIRNLQRHTQDLLEQLLALDGELVNEEPTIEQFTTEDGQEMFVFPPVKFIVQK